MFVILLSYCISFPITVMLDICKRDHCTVELVFQVILDRRVRREVREALVRLEVVELQDLPVSRVRPALRAHLVRRAVLASLVRRDQSAHKASLDSLATLDFPGSRDSLGLKVSRASWVTLVVLELLAFQEQQVLLVLLVPLEVQAHLVLLVLSVLSVSISSLYLLHT